MKCEICNKKDAVIFTKEKNPMKRKAVCADCYKANEGVNRK